MKTRLWLVLGMTSLFILSSCNEDKIISNNQLVKSISITGQDFQSGEPGTKAAYSVDGTGMHFSWTQGDTVGIFPVGGDQVAFPISSGEGSETAQFDGGAWALRSSFSYAAYYPFSESNYHIDETKLPVSYIGQAQNGNGSLAGLDRFDYQASVATSPDASGNVNIALKHLGCFVRFQLKMPVSDTYKSMTITSSKTPFITSGTFDLSSDSIQVKPKTTSQTIVVSLNNTSTTPQDSILTVFAMFAPIDLSDSDIRIVITGTSNETYTSTVSGKKMEAGKAYSYGSNIKISRKIDGYEYVDLGLSVLWATCNVGADNEEDYGDYYAWGETETYYSGNQSSSLNWIKENGYSLPSYRWCEGDTETGNIFTKYCFDDFYGKKGYADYKTVLDEEDDVAHVKWGGKWRMPTDGEFKELLDSCTWVWTSIKGVEGYKVTSNRAGYSDQSVFLPAAGIMNGLEVVSTNTRGCYRSCTLGKYSDRTFSLDCANYSGSYIYYLNVTGRANGFSVRPVWSELPPKPWVKVSLIDIENDSIFLNPGETSNLQTNVYSGVNVVDVPVSYLSNDTLVATIDEKGKITAKSAGSALITVRYEDLYSICYVVVQRNISSDIEYEYVDLGLSVNWATCNIGATSPEEYGDYYAWGEIRPKENYLSSTYKWSWYNADNYTYEYTKYNNNSLEGYVDNKKALELYDDAAYINWGGSWRMPTSKEVKDLVDNCTWKWTVRNGINGFEVKSNVHGYQDKSIFLPAAGYCEYSEPNWSVLGSYGYYWSSTLDNNYSGNAMSLFFTSSSHSINNEDGGHQRCSGFSIRPVCKSETWAGVTSITLDKNYPSMDRGEVMQLKATVKNGNNVVDIPLTWTSSNPSVAIVDENGTVYAKSAGTTVISASYRYITAGCYLTVNEIPLSTDYEAVDMGLSVKWATFNVGASFPEDYGYYYAWGETEPKNNYQSDTYKWYRDTGTYRYFGKYEINTDCVVFYDLKYVLEDADDVAHVKWGGSWRIPSKEELDELVNNCSWTWTFQKGTYGYVVNSKIPGYTDRSIFLPASGYYEDKQLKQKDYKGYYWTNGLMKEINGYSWFVDCLELENEHSSITYYSRVYGISVRPVCPK